MNRASYVGDAKHDDAKEPVHNRRLPFDKHVVLEHQSHTPKDKNYKKGNKVGGFKSMLAQPCPDHLSQGCNNGDDGCGIDAIELVGAEK